MNLVVIGTGYVGLVTGVGFASLGNTVSFVDLDENKITKLNSKKVPFYEPGLEEHFQDGETFSRMSFSSTYKDINWDVVDVAFICVQTPNNLDMEYNSSRGFFEYAHCFCFSNKMSTALI